jgi:hypothetical protein
LTFLGIRILPLGTYLDIHICKIEATEKYKIVNFRPPNVDAEKLSFPYVLKLEISVKRIALCQKDSLRRKIRRKIFFLLFSGFFCQSTSLTLDRVYLAVRNLKKRWKFFAVCVMINEQNDKL